MENNHESKSLHITKDRIDQFEQQLIFEEKSKATVTKYVNTIKELMVYISSVVLEEDFNSVNSKNTIKRYLVGYRNHLQENLVPQTVNTKISAINSYLKYIGKEELSLKFLKVQRRTYIAENRELTEREYKRLLKCAREEGKHRLYMILLTIRNTGIRISELRYITVEAVKLGRARISMKGKIREVLLKPELCKKLKEYIKSNNIKEGHIFRTKNGKPLDRSNIHHEMKRLSIKAHVDSNKVFPHNLRHLFAVAFYAIEKDLAHLADVLGHSRIETTRIYVSASIKTHMKTLNKMVMNT